MKTANILWSDHLFPHEMRPEKQLQEIQTDNMSLPRSVLLIHFTIWFNQLLRVWSMEFM